MLRKLKKIELEIAKYELKKAKVRVAQIEEEIAQAEVAREEEMERQRRVNAYAQMHWTRVLRCLGTGAVIMPNENRGDFSLFDDLDKLERIFASLYEMRVLPEHVYYGFTERCFGLNNIGYNVRKQIEKMREEGKIKDRR